MNKIRILKFIIPLAIGVLCLGILYFQYRPRPIVPDAGHCMIARVQVRVNGTLTDYEENDYDEERLIHILSNFYERRTLEKAGPFSLNDVDISILIITKTGLKEILLGAITYTYEEEGRPKYAIIDAQELEMKLREALLIDD